MTGWMLVMVLKFAVGPSEPLELIAARTFESVEQCHEAGRETANWLVQDFVTPEWRCIKIRR